METVNTSPLFSYAAAAALSNGSLYRDRTRDRDELLAFMDANEWFGSSYEQNGDEFMVVMTAEIKNAVSIWINAYRRTNDEKVEILLTLLEKTFPQTSQRFRRYMASEGKGNDRSTWKVLDFMAASLKKELDEYSEEEIKELTASAYSVIKMKELSLFHAFLSYGGEGKPYTDWNYQFKSHQLVKADNTAYAIKDFALMAYIVLNQDAWSENHLVEKALDNRRYAELWMFSALHFICALRTTDIVRLPVPALPYDAETIREKIREGSFSDADAYGIAFELQFRCRMRSSRPHKTLKKGISPEIKLFIPESLHVPLGFIMAIALSFRSEDDPFVSTDFTLQDIIRFFGEDFVRASGYRKFKSRRANKSYLQGIEAVADDIAGNPKGYMLASLARSHKGGIGKLSEITDVYLRDAKFTGEDPAFVLKEMFERGIFGFIPCMLLEMYEGKSYQSLSVREQTAVIQALGMDAWQIESVALSLTMSYQQAGEIVKSTLLEAGGEHCLEKTLQNLASGWAVSKGSEFMCLRRAAGLECLTQGSASCLGCGYEIYTKTAMEMLVREYIRMNRLIRESENSNRIKDILKKFIIPSILQIFQSIAVLYPEADMDILQKIVERGMKDADIS